MAAVGSIDWSVNGSENSRLIKFSQFSLKVIDSSPVSQEEISTLSFRYGKAPTLDNNGGGGDLGPGGRAGCPDDDDGDGDGDGDDDHEDGDDDDDGDD